MLIEFGAHDGRVRFPRGRRAGRLVPCRTAGKGTTLPLNSIEQARGAAVVRFLDVIGFSEGTSTSPHTENDGYDIVVPGINGAARRITFWRGKS